MKQYRKFLVIPVMFLAVFALAACQDEVAPKSKTTQAQKAAKAADSIKFNGNAEIDNIKKRLELTSKPGMLGYVALINDVGQVLMYTPVKGKITSGGKRLTPGQKFVKADCGQNTCEKLVKAPSDEGTHGSSSPYIYFWTTGGQYVQWSGLYLFSDKPFRLTQKPILFATAGAEEKVTAN
jgi:hypothetical protein